MSSASDNLVILKKIIEFHFRSGPFLDTDNFRLFHFQDRSSIKIQFFMENRMSTCFITQKLRVG